MTYVTIKYLFIQPVEADGRHSFIWTQTMTLSQTQHISNSALI